MKDKFTEFLVVLSHSPRTRWILIIGVVVAIVTWLLGKWWIGNIELTGPLAGATEVIETLIRDRYAGVSLGIFVTSFVGAVKTYQHDHVSNHAQLILNSWETACYREGRLSLVVSAALTPA